jgi:hypothetical protein
MVFRLGRRYYDPVGIPKHVLPAKCPVKSAAALKLATCSIACGEKNFCAGGVATLRVSNEANASCRETGRGASAHWRR